MGLAKIGYDIIAKRCTKFAKSILRAKPQRIAHSKSLKFAQQLEKDTLDISGAAKRWLGKPEQYIPDYTIPNCKVPSHHDIDGKNHFIRDICADDLRKGILSTGEGDELDVVIDALTIARTDNEFARLAPLEKDCIAYRAVKRPSYEGHQRAFKVIENAKVGDIIVPDYGCGYASPVRDLAESFMGDFYGKGMMYTIRIPKGARVSRSLEHGGEILMPRGAEYKLISKEVGFDGNTHVTLEYLLPKTIIPEDIQQIKKAVEPCINSTDKTIVKYAKRAMEEIQKLEEFM
jgi:hypothetical protein